MTPAEVHDAASARQLVLELYGEPLERPAGVLHVVAAFRDAGNLRVLRIGEAAPKSDHDFFALNLARARAEAILTSGAVLRDEPALSCRIAGPARAGLIAWRREVASITAAPRILVLTTGRGLPLQHPLLREERVALYVPRASAAELRRALPDVEVIGDDAPSARRAIAHLEREGARTISIEAGPSVARTLYEAPLSIDEVMLSIFEGEVVPAARGGAFVEEAALSRQLRLRSEALRDGCWRLTRWTTSPARGR